MWAEGHEQKIYRLQGINQSKVQMVCLGSLPLGMSYITQKQYLIADLLAKYARRQCMLAYLQTCFVQILKDSMSTIIRVLPNRSVHIEIARK